MSGEHVHRRLVIEGELSIFRAGALMEELRCALLAADEVEIDLSQVEEVDSAGIQLLLAAKREAADRGKSLRLSGHSRSILDSFELLDLAGHFGDPVLIPRA